MADNYQFRDAYGSVLTAAATEVSSALQPIVRIASSVITVIPTGSNQSVSGQIGASVLGTVPVTQSGIWSPSALGYAIRNDAVASFLGANLTSIPRSSDSAGRTITKPFAPSEAFVSGISSVTSASITSLVPAGGAGLRNYLTDVLVANTGSVATQVTFRDGDASIIGRTIAPATGGSNIHLSFPMRTGGFNQQIDVISATPVSILTISGFGYRAP